MSSLRLLLIARDGSELLASQQLLEQKHGSYQWDYSNSVEEAILKLAAYPVDAVILETGLVDQNVPTLLTQLKKNYIPGIVLAQIGEEDAIAELIGQGMVGYLLKDDAHHYFKLLPCTLEQAIKHVQLIQATESKQQHHWGLGQQKILELLASETPLTEILNLLLQALEAQDKSTLGSILLRKGNALIHAASPSLPPAYTQAMPTMEIGPQAGSCGTAAYRKAPVIVTDIATDPLWDSCRELPLQYGLRACWAVPICSKSGAVLGILALYHRDPCTPTPDDWERVTVATQLASLAIERKQTEYALIQSESRFRATFEQVAVGICHIGLEGRFLRFNQRLCEITGYAPEELASLTFQEITHPDDLPLDLRRIQQLLRDNHASYTLETRYIHRDRSIVWVDLTVSMVCESSSESPYLIAVIQDISDRKQAEVNLRRSEKLYASLAKAVPVGIFRTDSHGNCYYVNDRWCQIAHLQAHQALNNGWIEAIHAGDREQVFAEWQSAIQEQRPFRLEYRFQQPDGTLSWVYGQAVAEYDANGQLTGFIGSITNITDRKQAEAALHQLNQELENRVEQRTLELQQLNRQLQRSIAERQKLAALVENSTDFIMITTPSGRMTYLNRAGHHLVGMDENADITNYALADFYFPADWEKFQQPLLQTLASGEVWQGELPLRHFQTQAAIPVMHSAFPIKHPQTGGILGIGAILRNISERKQTEQQLRDLSDHLSLAVTSGGIGTWEWDIAKNEVSWDDRMYELYGLHRSDFSNVYQAWLHTVHPDDQAEMERISLQARRGEREYNPEFRVIHADGSIHFIQAHALIQRNPMGEPLRMVGINYDITHRKQIEAAIRDSEQRYASLAEAAPVAIFRFDVTGQCIYVNDRWSEMTGRPIAAGLGWKWADTLHPEDYNRIVPVVEQWVQSCRAGDLYRNEARIVRPDGSICWFFCQIVPETNANGALTGFVGTLTDISDRKQAEQNLQNSEARFRSYFDLSLIGMAITSTEKRWVEANNRLCAILGYSHEELTQLTWADMTHPDDLEPNLAYFNRVLAGESEGYSIEKRFIRKDGEVIFTSISAACLRRSDQTIDYFVVLIQDISSQKQSELALQQSEARNRAILEAMPDLLLRLQKDGTCLDCILPKSNQTHFLPITNHISEILSAELLQQQLDTIDQAILTQELQVYEQQLVKRDQILYEEIRVAAINSEEVLIIIRDITDKKESELALRESRSALLEAQRVAHIGSWEFDVKTQTITWSEELFRMFALDPSQPPPSFEAYLQRIYPDDRDLLIRSIETAIADGIPYMIDFRIILPDGSLRYQEGRGKVIQEDGRVVKLFGTALDITERKQVELELQKNRDLREAIFEESADALFLVNPVNDLIVDCNHRAVLMFEAEAKEELLNQCGNAFQRYPFSPEELAAIIQKLALTGCWEQEIEYVTRKGRYFWANVASNTITIANQDWRLARLKNISARKAIEARLQQQLNKEQLLVSILMRIRDSLELKAILQTAVDDVRQLIGCDRVLVYQIREDSTGITVAESVVEPWRQILDMTFPAEAFPPSCYQRYVQGATYVIHDRNATPIVECMVEFMQELQILAKLAVPIVQKENRKLWGLLIAHQCSSPRLWEDWEIGLLQQLSGQLAIAIQQADLYQQLQSELYERQRTEANLTAINEQLQLANLELARVTRLKDEFLANMSHELRTPLNAVLGMTESLQDNVFGPVNQPQQKALSTIEKSGRHLLDLINDILDLAKIESGKLEPEFALCRVQYLCASSLNLVKQIAYQKNIQLTMHVAPNLESIEVDERRLRQVLINLLSNAIKFTPNGGAVSLEVWVQPADLHSPIAQAPQPTPASAQLIYFSVVDTGIGIATEDKSKLFQTFVQIDSRLNRQYSGTGLGLALVKRITELHGGWVELESQPGKGSRFTVVLPYHARPQLESVATPESTPESQVSDHPELATTHVDPDQHPLILLAEDNQANIATYTNYLTCSGFRVIVAMNGLDAIAMAQQHRPDLILMDIQMPDLDGLAATRQIRSLPDFANTPIIALTALAMAGDQEQCIEAGVNEYLAKPVRMRYLVDTMARLLQSQKS